MMNKTIASVVLASLCSFASAQTDTINSVSTGNRQHYIGLQANELLRQLINFSEDDTPVDNPYLLTYSINGPSGVGVSLGLGYEFDEIRTQDGQFDRETNFDNFSLRIGPEKKFWLGKKWMATAGGDILFQSLKNETTNKTESDFGKSEITTTNKSSGWGFGPRLGISFQVTKNIFLGTEATYYFKKLKSKGEVTSSITIRQTDFEGNVFETTSTETTDTEDKTKELQFNVPAVLFLIVRF